MWWLALLLIWWCGSAAIPSPGGGGGGSSNFLKPPPKDEWKCPEIAEQPIVECSCDMPHTLRCTGDKTALGTIGLYTEK